MFSSNHEKEFPGNLAHFTIRALITVSGGIFALTLVVFGDMLKYNCQMQHVWFIYSFFASLVAALLTPLALWLGEGKTLRKLALASVVLSFVMLALGGTQFIWAFAQNQIVSCPDESAGDGSGQPYGA